MARALRERDPCYAAATHALSDVLIEEARKQQCVPSSARPAALLAPEGSAGSSAGSSSYHASLSTAAADGDGEGGGDPPRPPPNLYMNIRGAHGLIIDDPAWGRIEEAQGLTSTAPVKGEREDRNFSELGFCARETYVNNLIKYEVQDSDVVCFESAAADECGMHAAVMLGDGLRGAFPPNTRFTLKEVIEGGFTAPNGVRVQQRLLVVTATFAWQLSTREEQRVRHVVMTAREANITRALIGTLSFDARGRCGSGSATVGGGSSLRLPPDLARYIARLAAALDMADAAAAATMAPEVAAEEGAGGDDDDDEDGDTSGMSDDSSGMSSDEGEVEAFGVGFGADGPVFEFHFQPAQQNDGDDAEGGAYDV